MGQPAHAALAELVREFSLNTFVETGTGWGQGVRDALEVPTLRHVHSIEVDEETYLRNVQEFKREIRRGRVTLWLGDSRKVLSTVAHSINPMAGVVWYLDAHFAGSGRAVPVPMLPLAVPATDAVPLVDEVKAIWSVRDMARDVVIIDDRVLWEADDYEAGDDPSFRAQLQRNDVLMVEQLLPHHHVARLKADMGYAVFHP